MGHLDIFQNKSSLGKHLVVSEILVRKTNSEGYKYWEAKQLEKKRTAILIGYRTLSNGYRRWQGSQEGYTYEPKEYIKVRLVVFSTREKPVYIK